MPMLLFCGANRVKIGSAINLLKAQARKKLHKECRQIKKLQRQTEQSDGTKSFAEMIRLVGIR